MKLTGKALQDFTKWVFEKYGITYTELYEKVYLNALIIEWFDSVGIYINIMLDETTSKKFKFLITDINIRHLHCWTEGVNKDNRKESTTEAIEKANEIYNNQNK